MFWQIYFWSCAFIYKYVESISWPLICFIFFKNRIILQKSVKIAWDLLLSIWYFDMNFISDFIVDLEYLNT